MQPSINPKKIEKSIIRYRGNSKVLKLSKSKNFGTRLKSTSWELRIPNHIKENVNTELMPNLNIQINKLTLLI